MTEHLKCITCTLLIPNYQNINNKDSRTRTSARDCFRPRFLSRVLSGCLNHLVNYREVAAGWCKQLSSTRILSFIKTGLHVTSAFAFSFDLCRHVLEN